MANVTYIAPVKAENVVHKIRCAAYCRVSSSSEDQIHSYAAQVKFYSEKFIGSETEELVDIYADEGISGTDTAKRTEFQRLIRDCKRGKIDRIYTKSLSRFARNTKDCLNTVRLLRELGISIYFEKENIDTAKTNDELIITVMGGLAQEESTSISQNMRWSARKRMESGTFVQSIPPYGYTMNEGRLEINADQAEIVKNIYKWYLSGMGITQIAIKLSEMSIPTMRDNDTWKPCTIRHILSNERYIGDSLLQKFYSTDTLPIRLVENKGERDKFLVKNTHEPIISKGTYERVQDMFKKREDKYYKGIGSKSIFTSIIKCSKCGASYKRKKSRDKYYWVCKNHDMNAKYCDATGIPEESLKQLFVLMCNKLIQHYREILLPLRRSLQELNMRRFSGNTKVLDIHKNIADIKEQRHVLSRLKKKGFMDEKKYAEKLTELENQLARQERELKKTAKADNEDDTLEQLEILIDSIEKHDGIITEFDEELFSSIIERIIVRDKCLEFILISGLSFKENI